MSAKVSNKIFDVINIILLLVITGIVLYPLYFTIIASVSNPYAVSRGDVLFWLKDFTLEPYINVFKNSSVWVGYKNSIMYTLIVTAYSLFLTIPCAYVLSRKGIKGKNVIMTYFVITMYFSGGMIPSYLLVRNLNLINTMWAVILPFGFTVYNMIVARTFFQANMSDELYEAAKIDGANEYQIFFKIVLPLSSAIIAVIALYVAVANWNSYFSAMLYLDDKKLFPLQVVLRNILILNQNMSVADMASLEDEEVAMLLRRELMAQGMKYSLVFIASAPVLIMYPFVQKHFVKGVMVGALKG
jgi:putative aldouronate transport system permease protein